MKSFLLVRARCFVSQIPLLDAQPDEVERKKCELQMREGEAFNTWPSKTAKRALEEFEPAKGNSATLRSSMVSPWPLLAFALARPRGSARRAMNIKLHRDLKKVCINITYLHLQRLQNSEQGERSMLPA